MIKTPVNQVLNTSTYVALTNGADACYGFTLLLSESASFYIAIDASGTGETIIPDTVGGIFYPDLVPPEELDQIGWSKVAP